MDIAKVRSDLQIDFPSNIKEWLRSESELAVFLEGNTSVEELILAVAHYVNIVYSLCNLSGMERKTAKT